MYVSSMSNPSGCGGPVVGESGFLPSLSVATQPEELIQGPYKLDLPRGNAQVSWTFTVNRTATTQDAMLAFLADHPPLVPQVATLSLYVASTVRYLKNAVLGSIQCVKQRGTDFSFTYTYRGSYVPPSVSGGSTGTGGPFTTS